MLLEISEIKIQCFTDVIAITLFNIGLFVLNCAVLFVTLIYATDLAFAISLGSDGFVFVLTVFIIFLVIACLIGFLSLRWKKTHFGAASLVFFSPVIIQFLSNSATHFVYPGMAPFLVFLPAMILGYLISQRLDRKSLLYMLSLSAGSVVLVLAILKVSQAGMTFAGISVPITTLLTSKEICVMQALAVRNNEGDRCHIQCTVNRDGVGIGGGCGHVCGRRLPPNWKPLKTALECYAHENS